MNKVIDSPQRISILEKTANRFHVEPNRMLQTLKQTAFQQSPNAPEITNEQMIALLVIADQYKLNPFTREIFAFPDKKKGIIPIVSVDGWSRIINTNANFDGMEFRDSGDRVKIDEDAKPAWEWLECVMYRKDRDHPTVIREYLDEVYRPAFVGHGRDGDYKIPGPWQTHTKRMLRHKAMIQCARLAFGFSDIYDADEAERVIEGQVIREGITVEASGPGADDLNASILGQQDKPAAELAAPTQDEISLEDMPLNQQKPIAEGVTIEQTAAAQQTEEAPKKRKPGRPRKKRAAQSAPASQKAPAADPATNGAPPPAAAPQDARQGETADVTPGPGGEINADWLSDQLMVARNVDEVNELLDLSNSLQDPQEKGAIQAIAAKRVAQLNVG